MQTVKEMKGSDCRDNEFVREREREREDSVLPTLRWPPTHTSHIEP